MNHATYTVAVSTYVCIVHVSREVFLILIIASRPSHTVFFFASEKSTDARKAAWEGLGTRLYYEFDKIIAKLPFRKFHS